MTLWILLAASCAALARPRVRRPRRPAAPPPPAREGLAADRDGSLLVVEAGARRPRR